MFVFAVTVVCLSLTVASSDRHASPLRHQAPVLHTSADASTPGAAHETPQDAETTLQYLKRLGLGKTLSIAVVFSADCEECLKQVPFFKRVIALPGMDGTKGRFMVLTRNGAVPAFTALKNAGFSGHTVGSYPEDPLELPSALGSVVILDRDGKILTRWSGAPSSPQQEDILAKLKSLLR